MKKLCVSLVCLSGIFHFSLATYAQEDQQIDVEQSAEVFLEQYTDEFQESFFEALKQKGIENYDKAINLLLECKRLDVESTAVDHELAKAYLADKQYILAQEYGLEALNASPANYWYLNTLVEILIKQGSTISTLDAQIPFDSPKLKENLALIYFRLKNYESALEILNDLRTSEFKQQLTNKINDSITKKQRDIPKKENTVSTTTITNPLKRYNDQIAELIEDNDFSALLEITSEALESFPSQPYYYYAQGLGFNKNSNAKKAVEVLEMALDYLLEDSDLADKIYKELATAHTSLGNISKANMYLSKIKSGS
ncbi:tetratricopeptide repeat protein [Muriicola sp. Z0-33]|uniref:tetratricopeptide repeat protein n=1 Tax=Muriicola sp. Z0-33 TaxID=2816957 RepID=UPI0022389110|nr:hypothetical protein [Muriicola sp. Z0-33]MCW5514612.1 hypothetical protein [Muriicola sp. Z0-33]